MESKKKKYKAVIFDLDGTILYTLKDIAAAVNAPLVNRGITPLTEKEVRPLVGNGLLNSLIGAYKFRNYEISDNDLSISYKELIDYYNNYPTKFCAPYEGMNSFLKRLDIPSAILSNKKDEIVKKIVAEKFSDIDFFSIIGTVSEDTKKPNPIGVIKFSQEANIKMEDILFVGDSEVDFLTSKNAKCDVALVSWGYRDKEELEKLNVPIVDNTEDLWGMIHGN